MYPHIQHSPKLNVIISKQADLDVSICKIICKYK